jgi:hypothetical protein
MLRKSGNRTAPAVSTSRSPPTAGKLHRARSHMVPFQSASKSSNSTARACHRTTSPGRYTWSGKPRGGGRTRDDVSPRVSAFHDYLEQRWKEGCHNATQLWHEIEARGSPGMPTWGYATRRAGGGVVAKLRLRGRERSWFRWRPAPARINPRLARATFTPPNGSRQLGAIPQTGLVRGNLKIREPQSCGPTWSPALPTFASRTFP